MITDPIAITVILAAAVFVAVWLERYKVFRALGSALMAILLAMALSNVGLLPGVSPAYDVLASTGVSVAIVLILLGVRLRSVISAGPSMLAAFGIGAVGTAAGATLATFALASSIGPEAWKLAGQYTGTYTGGGVNFAALARELDTSPDLFSAAVAADVALTAIWLIACLSIPLLLRTERADSELPDEQSEARTGSLPAGPDPDGIEGSTAGEERGDEDDDTLAHSLHETAGTVSLSEAAALVTLGLGLVWLAARLAAFVPVPEVLLLTTLVLLIAQVPAVRRLGSSALWGNYLLHLFLAANGAQSVIANIFAIGPAVFWFATITVGVHGLVIFGAGWLAGLDPRTLAVASQANVGGPASAMALSGARGYTEQMLPGIAVGLLGYAVGNYLGFGIATAARAVLLG